VDALVLTELVPLPQQGRVFEQEFRPGFADCAPSGRLRLDAIARWLQDVAYADVVDAELADQAVWVVRRSRIRVQRFPRVGEGCVAATFCSGLGRMWAERRTSITPLGGGDSHAEAVVLWVHLDPVTGRPIPFSGAEASVYGASTAGRRVTARLRHPAPSWHEERHTWTFRSTELDIAGHVNNAAYWQPLEDELLAGPDPAHADVELEYRTPCQPGEKLLLRDGSRRWIASEDREIHASIMLADVVVGSGQTGSRSGGFKPVRGQASD
jgi:acyl-ACP thioesterase